MVIDAHQHFWYYQPDKHNWIDNEMSVIRRDFLPEDLLPVLLDNGVDGCVAVQADQTLEETHFLLQLADENSFIKAVVGWVDLRDPNIAEQLALLIDHAKLKGFRHVLQGEEPSFMLQPDFIRGIAALSQYNFTYDILIFPQHLASTLKLVQQFPKQRFVIDHIAKPMIKNKEIREWNKGVELIAKHENVFCKISGMVTEADYKYWQYADFVPYLDVIVASFGINRIMFGSDWPVCLVAADYRRMMHILKDYFTTFSPTEQSLLFGKNAIKFYNI